MQKKMYDLLLEKFSEIDFVCFQKSFLMKSKQKERESLSDFVINKIYYCF